jgi:hypothetical protein
LSGATEEELGTLIEGGPLPRLRERLAHLADNLRYEEAARLRDRIEALEQVIDRLHRLERLRKLELRLVCPGAAFVVAGGRVTTDEQPPRPLEGPLTAEQAEDLLLIDGFVRRPPPELKVLPLAA